MKELNKNIVQEINTTTEIEESKNKTLQNNAPLLEKEMTENKQQEMNAELLSPVLKQEIVPAEEGFETQKSAQVFGKGLINSFSQLNATNRLFYFNSREMKLVKENMNRVMALFNTEVTAVNFEEMRMEMMNALDEVVRTCENYASVKIKHPENDKNVRHKLVLEIKNYAKQSLDFFEQVSRESYTEKKISGKKMSEVMDSYTEPVKAKKEDVEEKKERALRIQHNKLPDMIDYMEKNSSTFSVITYFNRATEKLKSPVPLKEDKFKAEKGDIETQYKFTIEQCKAYLKNAKPSRDAAIERYNKAREILHILEQEQARLKKLNYDDMELHGKTGNSWLEALMPGSVSVKKSAEGKGFDTDDGRSNVTFATEDQIQTDLMVNSLFDTLNTKMDIHRKLEKAELKNEDGSVTKGYIYEEKKQDPKYKWTSMDTLLKEAGNNQVPIVYSENALAQLNKMQVMDFLMGKQTRSQNSISYLAKMQNVEGSQCIVINSVMSVDNEGLFSTATLEDFQKEGRQKDALSPDAKEIPNQNYTSMVLNEKGNLALPYFDRKLNEAILKMDGDAFLNKFSGLSDEQKNAFKTRLTGYKNAVQKENSDEESLTNKVKEREEKIKERKKKRIEQKIAWGKSMGVDDDAPVMKEQYEKLKKLDSYVLEKERNQYSIQYRHCARRRLYTGYAVSSFTGMMKEVSDDEIKLEEIKEEKVQEVQKDQKEQVKDQAKKKRKKVEAKPETDFASRIKKTKEFIWKINQEKKRLGNSDTLRVQSKEKLKENIAEDKSKNGQNEDFMKVLKALSDYADMNISSQSGYETNKDGDRIYKNDKINAEIKALQDAVTLAEDLKTRLKDKDPALTARLDFYLGEIKNMSSGALKMEAGARNVIVKDTQFVDFEVDEHDDLIDKTSVKNYETFDKKSEPLFAHEPCIGDVVQGHLGDCYAIAAIATVVEKNPEAIKKMMKDNGDTVTVRFYDRKGAPVYITVEKTVPKYTGADNVERERFTKGALWVQMIEKAFAASPLADVPMIWANERGEQKEDRDFQVSDLKEKNQCSFKNIKSGRSEGFLTVITGKKSQNGNFEASSAEPEEQFKPVHVLHGNVANNFWSDVRKNAKNKVFTVGTKSDFPETDDVGMNEENMMKGIASSHAYTVIGIKEIGDREMIELRNPWGVGTVDHVYNETTGDMNIRASKNEAATGSIFLTKDMFFTMFDHFAVTDISRMVK